MISPIRLRFIAVLMTLFFTPSPWAADAMRAVADAERLLAAGKPTEALRILEPLEFEHAGNTRFDYTYGIVALESGELDRATFILERVLAMQPGNVLARMQMGRAYYLKGDNGRSRGEFDRVLGHNPDDASRKVAMDYLQAITDRERALRISLKRYVEVSLGHDDNINNANAASQITLPGYNNYVYEVDPTYRATKDNYAGAAAGIEYSYRPDPGWGMFVGTDTRTRGNFRRDGYDFATLDARFGILLGRPGNQGRIALGLGTYRLDDKRYRDSKSVSGDWLYNLNPTRQISMFGILGQYRFPQVDYTSQNYDLGLIGGGWIETVNQGRTQLFANLLYGRENDTDTRQDGGKRLAGMRFGGGTSLQQQLGLYVNMGATRSLYDRENSLFLATREDRQVDMVLGMNWIPQTDWQVRPQLTYIRNKSNIPFNDYERTDFSVTLRREFR